MLRLVHFEVHGFSARSCFLCLLLRLQLLEVQATPRSARRTPETRFVTKSRSIFCGMKCLVPQLAWWLDTSPLFSVDFQPKNDDKELRIATCGTDTHVRIWWLKLEPETEGNKEKQVSETKKDETRGILSFSSLAKPILSMSLIFVAIHRDDATYTSKTFHLQIRRSLEAQRNDNVFS